MKLNEAIAIRIRSLLNERNISQYRLEQNAGISHSTMMCLMNGKYKGCNISTVVLIIKAFGITIAEFFDDPVFTSEDLIVE